VFSQKEVMMIRLLFRVTGKDGATTLHSAEVHGSKSALLLDTPNVEIIGFEDCRDQDIPMTAKNERLFGNWIRNQWGPTHPGGVSATWKNEGDGGIPIPPHLVAEIENVFKDSERPDVVYTPGEPEIPCGGATAMDYRELYERKEIQPAEMSAAEIGKVIADRISEQRKGTEDPTVLQAAGAKTQLWLMLRPSGEFVKSTTEEGGESYIACTSFDEAQKVAEQQKIYDIECVPHRVF
jgi:hypothetical protein